ncbi:MAG: GGDEF domain-containing protein [Planctomycetota bacterium]
MFLDILIALSCAGVGAACGWIIHCVAIGQLTRSVDPSHSDGLTDEPRDPLDQMPSDPETIRAVADRLRQFASSFAEDIDVHQASVTTISTNLQSTDLSEVPAVAVDAVAQLIEANELVQEKLENTRQELRQQTKRLQSERQRSSTDALTDIGNRAVFDRELQRRTKVSTESIADAGVLVVLDVDHFKQFNDVYGHQAGDEVLRVIARTLEARLQPHGVVTRFGGEEFAVFLDVESTEAAAELIEPAREVIAAREIAFGGEQLKVTASFGMGQIDPGETSEGWLQRVDEALYQSKQAGRNCTHVWRDGRMHHAGMPIVEASQSNNSADDVANDAAVASSPVETPREPEESSETQILENVESMASDALSEMRAELNTTISDSPTAEAEPNETDPEESSGLTPADLESIQVELRGKPPETLNYLPDEAAMTDFVHDMATTSNRSGLENYLMSVRFSGQPTGATLRSLLQLVRAAVGNQDRIGCLDSATLLIAMPELTSKQAYQRGEEICKTSASAGITLAFGNLEDSEKRSNDNESLTETLSVGLVRLPPSALDGHEDQPNDDGSVPAILDPATVDQWIYQSLAVAELAAQQDKNDNAYPVLTHQLQ